MIQAHTQELETIKEKLSFTRFLINFLAEK